MPRKDIVDHIKEKMNWDGTSPLDRKVGQDDHQHGQRLLDWNRKVRRDILVIEYHLKKLIGPDGFYDPADPGDPPPPPPDT